MLHSLVLLQFEESVIHLFCKEAEGIERPKEGERRERVEVHEVEERPIFSVACAGVLWMDLEIVVTSSWI